MNWFGVYEQRVVGGFLIIGCFVACFVFMIVVFYTDAGDEERIFEQVHEERRLRNEMGQDKSVPKISKWDFSITLPVEGTTGANQWKVEGAYSTYYRRHGQLIYDFIGETLGGGNPVKLMSPKMAFDDQQRELSTSYPIYAELGWGSVTGTGLRLRWLEDLIIVRDDVEVALKPGQLPEEVGGSGDSDGKRSEEKEDGDGTEDENEEKEPGEDSDVLIITSNTLKIFGKEDRAKFIGDVVARDKRGTIWADVMNVQNYTKEERKADPEKKGVKTVVCIGHVRIDLEEKAAKCHYAEFDSATSIITLIGHYKPRHPDWHRKAALADIPSWMRLCSDLEYIQVDYWEEDKHQITSDVVIMNRETKEVEFKGRQRTVSQMSDSQESFFNFSGDDDDSDDGKENDSGDGEKDKGKTAGQGKEEEGR